MRPQTAAAYIGAQNAVADDFLQMIRTTHTEGGPPEDLAKLLLKYTMECKWAFCNRKTLFLRDITF